MSTIKTRRVCEFGHQYFKSSDCPTCPICENKKKVNSTDFLKTISAPARRAFEREGILILENLTQYTEKQILSLHGVGPSVMPKLHEALANSGLTFKSNSLITNNS
jgi:hypothetical protein